MSTQPPMEPQATDTYVPDRDDSESPPPTSQLYNRGQELPQELPNQLDDLPVLLQGFSNYDTWSFLIEATLESVSIPQLIHASIPHPDASDPSYHLWSRTSLSVKNWLVRQLASPFLSRVIRNIPTLHPTPTISSPSNPAPPIFADTMYAIIRRVALSQSPGLQALNCESAYFNCLFMDRHHYPSAGHYVSAFRDAVHLTNRLYCTVTAYCAALLVLRGVGADMPALVDVKTSELDREYAPRVYSFLEFDSLCDFLIMREEGLNARYGDGDGDERSVGTARGGEEAGARAGQERSG